jgi:hypothetical protein
MSLHQFYDCTSVLLPTNLSTSASFSRNSKTSELQNMLDSGNAAHFRGMCRHRATRGRLFKQWLWPGVVVARMVSLMSLFATPHCLVCKRTTTSSIGTEVSEVSLPHLLQSTHKAFVHKLILNSNARYHGPLPTRRVASCTLAASGQKLRYEGVNSQVAGRSPAEIN